MSGIFQALGALADHLNDPTRPTRPTRVRYVLQRPPARYSRVADSLPSFTFDDVKLRHAKRAFDNNIRRGEISISDLRDTLTAFSFDAARAELCEHLRELILQLHWEDLADLRDTFTFNSFTPRWMR